MGRLENLLIKALPSALTNTNGNGEGNSTPPITPTSDSSNGPLGPPTSLGTKSASIITQISRLESLKPEALKQFKKKIVTADLEAIIEPNTGNNIVYMASWYNDSSHRILDISQYGYDTNKMLMVFWDDLIRNNKGKIVYFHNWAG
jgi:hypothetical protein